MRKGLTFLCYKNELGHKQLLLIVFGIRNYRLAISFLSIHDSILSDSWLQKWRENFLAHFINPVSYKHNVRTTILRSRSISAQSWVMLWTPHFFVRFFVVVLGGVVFQFPNNLEKNLNTSFRKSYFLTFWWNLHGLCFILEQEVYWI